MIHESSAFLFAVSNTAKSVAALTDFRMKIFLCLALLYSGVGVQARPAHLSLNAQLVQRVKTNDVIGAKRLLQRGASPNARDDSGRRLWRDLSRSRAMKWNPRTHRYDHLNAKPMKPFVGPTVLMISARNGLLQVATVLLDGGAQRNLTGVDPAEADSNSTDTDLETHYTPLVMAMLSGSYRRDIEMMRLLLSRGADVNARLSNGMTALDSALGWSTKSIPPHSPEQKQHWVAIVEILRAAGAKTSCGSATDK